MKKAFFAFLLMPLLAGCAPGTVNYDANLTATSEKYSEFKMGQAEGRYADKVRAEVAERLARDFVAGDNGVVVNLKTLSADEGDRMSRWFWGPLAGSDSQGEIVVRAEFLNSEGESLGAATATGKIVVGVFGGSFDDAISSVAKQIHSAAVQRFKP